MLRSSASIYALLFLALIGLSSSLTFRSFGLSRDASSNFYGNFQNELLAKTAFEIAKYCLELKGAIACAKDNFKIENAQVHYTITEVGNFYDIEISVLHQNLRNLHTLRFVKRKKISKKGSQNVK